jgi:hypothetical protein
VKALARELRGFCATQGLPHDRDARGGPRTGASRRCAPSNTSHQALLDYAFTGHGGTAAASRRDRPRSRPRVPGPDRRTAIARSRAPASRRVRCFSRPGCLRGRRSAANTSSATRPAAGLASLSRVARSSTHSRRQEDSCFPGFVSWIDASARRGRSVPRARKRASRLGMRRHTRRSSRASVSSRSVGTTALSWVPEFRFSSLRMPPTTDDRGPRRA